MDEPEIVNVTYIYHTVTFHFLINNKQTGYFTQIHPSKAPRHFGAKTTQPDSYLETAPPPLFLDLVSRSELADILYYLRMF
jgi:hypothetical protein